MIEALKIKIGDKIKLQTQDCFREIVKTELRKDTIRVWFKYWRLTMNKINEKEYTRLKNGVLDLFETLAHSQGFYGRLIRDIKEAEASGVDTTDFFMQFKDCKSPVDIILKLECE